MTNNGERKNNFNPLSNTLVYIGSIILSIIKIIVFAFNSLTSSGDMNTLKSTEDVVGDAKRDAYAAAHAARKTFESTRAARDATIATTPLVDNEKLKATLMKFDAAIESIINATDEAANATEMFDVTRATIAARAAARNMSNANDIALLARNIVSEFTRTSDNNAHKQVLATFDYATEYTLDDARKATNAANFTADAARKAYSTDDNHITTQ
jgi:hypothetical protein